MQSLQTRSRLYVRLAVLAALLVACVGATVYVDDDAPNDPWPNDPSGSDPNEDGSAAHPWDSVQEAIDSATNSDVIIVLPGTYIEMIDFLGKDIAVRGTVPGDPNVVAATIIAGDTSPYPSGVDQVVMASDGSLVGLTIANGSTGVSYGDAGVGAWSPMIRNCLIRGCYYGIRGYVPYEHPDPVYPTIINNVIYGRLGGIWLDHQASGGGVHATIRNNAILGAEATFGRGIVYRMHKSLPTVSSNIISGWDQGIEFVYDTLFDQRTPLIHYNDLWNNNENYHCDDPGFGGVFDLDGVQGNIAEDPRWRDPNSGDFRLRYFSPCINTGLPNINAPTEIDFYGHARILHCRLDIGPHEWDEVGEGDFDGSGHVGSVDWLALHESLGGPGTTPPIMPPACLETYLDAFDTEPDDDIDLLDAAFVQLVYIGDPR